MKIKYQDILEPLKNCSICPRDCNANRLEGKLGYCKSDAGFNISSICIHRGEEPVIGGKKGICNIFFSRCNLQCVYCQNYQISRNTSEVIDYKMTLEQVISEIIANLDTGINSVGFVSASHVVPQMKIIISELRNLGRNPVFVYNTNGYDKKETIRQLDGWIDVYLPDFKYMQTNIAKEYSDAGNYPEIASAAIREMYRQKGSTVITNDDGVAESGLIIRHLVLPSHVSNSLETLQFIADEISPNVHISLMSQYYPTKYVENHRNLNRKIYESEYNQVIELMENLGMTRGWIQELESHQTYRPDFNESHPFE